MAKEYEIALLGAGTLVNEKSVRDSSGGGIEPHPFAARAYVHFHFSVFFGNELLPALGAVHVMQFLNLHNPEWVKGGAPCPRALCLGTETHQRS